ncbi:Histidinol-phosphate aminotransferase [Cocos nucifera]|uniref:Histidinol-phosphate aminotransferase n=1 Tax=Cocos nucifera TaxID=13894 RepID=A0A8K0N667_COCNU|nr:Histidinol-phosphate aminotransferase [Cocos nucifera]
MEVRRRRGERCGSSIWFMSLPSITPLFLLFLAFIGEATVNVSALNYTSTRRVPSLRLARIQSFLEKINKPAVRSIESPDKDIIDCVHRHKQAALDHPLLKNHKIQREAPQRPAFRGGRQPRNYNASDAARRAWQTWHHVGHCPKGTVPIRRSSVDDVLRARSLYHYGKKQQGVPLAGKVDAPDVVSGNGHEHAIAYTGNTQEIYGAKATINVWDPSVQMSNEFSLSQIWVLSGSFDGSDLNSIEAGWQVSPELYGDSSPRLFTYWTSDAYQATGCYNLLCSGFVQTNSRIAIGAAISPVSSYGGGQYDITILIWKDPKLGNWWMSFGDNMLVGYWPAELFTHLSDHATMVEWGGEVVNMRPNGGHTSTQMGSGHFAEEGFGKASYFRNLEVVDSDNSLSSAQSISTLAENTNCYDIKSFSNTDWGNHFYYGGPGSNPQCQ